MDRTRKILDSYLLKELAIFAKERFADSMTMSMGVDACATPIHVMISQWAPIVHKCFRRCLSPKELFERNIQQI